MKSSTPDRVRPKRKRKEQKNKANRCNEISKPNENSFQTQNRKKNNLTRNCIKPSLCKISIQIKQLRQIKNEITVRNPPKKSKLIDIMKSRNHMKTHFKPKTEKK